MTNIQEDVLKNAQKERFVRYVIKNREGMGIITSPTDNGTDMYQLIVDIRRHGILYKAVLAYERYNVAVQAQCDIKRRKTWRWPDADVKIYPAVMQMYLNRGR